MQLTSTEMQLVIDRVKERLLAVTAPKSEERIDLRVTKVSVRDERTKTGLEKRTCKELNVRLITCDVIARELGADQLITIPMRAIITPAARDLLIERGIEVVRQVRSVSNHLNLESPSGVAPLFVSGSVPWLAILADRLCPKQATVAPRSADDTSALNEMIRQHSTSVRRGVLITQAPHAACWQAARNERVRPVVLRDWSEVESVLREVPANLFIVSARSWTAASTINLLRRLVRLTY